MPTKIKNITKTYKHSGHTAWRKVSGEAVILDVDTAVYYSLKGPGLRIWELLEKSTPLDRIAAAIEDEYEASGDRIRKDLDLLIKKLKKDKLIEAA